MPQEELLRVVDNTVSHFLAALFTLVLASIAVIANATPGHRGHSAPKRELRIKHDIARATAEWKPGATVQNQVIVPDVISEPKHYGMHRHFTDAGGVLLFGGGVKKGFLYGKTADERPCKTIKNPVGIEDLHATIYHAVGISPKLSYEIELRPFYVTKDGKGKPIMDVF